MNQINYCQFQKPPRRMHIEVCKWNIERKDFVCLKNPCQIVKQLKEGEK